MSGLQERAELADHFIDELTAIGSAGNTGIDAEKKNMATDLLAKVTKRMMERGRRRRLVRTVWKRANLKARGCNARGTGRKTKVDNQKLRGLLKSSSSESCMFSSRWNDCLRPLKGSKAAVFREHKEELGMRYRQFCRRIQGSKIGIVPFKQQKGRCDICLAWQKQGIQPSAKVLSSFKEAAALYLPRYFLFEKDDVFRSRMVPAEDHQYMLGLMTYVREHATRKETRELRQQMCPHCSGKLQAVETAFLEGMAPCLEPMRLMNVHWSLEQYLDAGMRSDWCNPQPGVTYFLWDHKAPVQ